MSTYTVPIKVGLIIFPIIALLFTIPYMIKQYHKFGAIPFMRTFIIYSFILYLLIAWFMVILPLPRIEKVANMKGPWAQLHLFSFITDIGTKTQLNLTDIGTYINFFKSPAVYTMLFNLLLTIPFGVYLRYYFNKKWYEVLILTFMLSFFFEVTQFSCLFGIYPRPYRLFDVDDLLINTIGGMIGFLFAPIVSKFLPSRESLDEKAYEKGQYVSYPRRLIADLIDLVAVTIVVIFIPVLKNELIDLPLLMLILLLYFIVFTIVFGRTLGKFIVGIKVVNKDDTKVRIDKVLIRYIVKYVLYFEIFDATLSLGVLDKIGVFGIIIIVILYIILFVIYIKTIISAFNKKEPLVYETLSNTKIVSTISKKSVKKEKITE